ncbi:MAG: cytochrome-c peroxidase, partial [Planctomycetaceae bacterium]
MQSILVRPTRTLLLALLAAFPAVNATADEPPLGLPAVPCPDDNPQSAEKVSLGKQLYFDPRLSRDKTISCASCHDPAKGWSNGEQFATGVGGQLGGRNSPTMIKSGYGRFHFWDVRALTLENQSLGPFSNPIEMAMTHEELVDRLNKIEGY